MLNCANNGCKVLHRGPNPLLDLQIMIDHDGFSGTLFQKTYSCEIIILGVGNAYQC